MSPQGLQLIMTVTYRYTPNDRFSQRILARQVLQRGIACNAERCNTYSNSVCPSVRPSVTRWYPIQTNEHRITRSSL